MTLLIFFWNIFNHKAQRALRKLVFVMSMSHFSESSCFSAAHISQIIFSALLDDFIACCSFVLILMNFSAAILEKGLS